MAEDQDFDLSRLKKMAAVTYKIVSYPTKQGSRGVLTQDEVKLAIKLAFSKWSDVSSFNFQPVESESADILSEFGDFYTVLNKYLSPKNAYDLAERAKSNKAIAVTANKLRSASEINSTPIPIVFDDAWWWTILSMENNPAPGLIGVITRTAEYAYACDLVTIAVHEIGHALGLGHNKNSSSIMQKTLGIWASTTCYYMTARPLPDVDAKDLELRYKSVDIPFDASHIGSVIVGSTFCQTNSTSDFPHYPCQDVDALCWGVRENTPTVPFMRGYGFNPVLQGEGYGYLNLHLMQVSDLQGRPYVVGGGTLMPVNSGPSVVPTIPPNGLTTLNDLSGWAAPQETKWGNETSLIQLCGRATRWNSASGLSR